MWSPGKERITMKKFNVAIDTIRREEYRLNNESQPYLRNALCGIN